MRILGGTYSFTTWATAIYPVIISLHVRFLPLADVTNQPSSAVTRFTHDPYTLNKNEQKLDDSISNAANLYNLDLNP